MYVIKAYGGLARHPQMTVKGLVNVICHEMGHLVGGEPVVRKGSPDDGMSLEGQADFYSTGVCFPLVAQYLNLIPEETEDRDLLFAKSLCDKTFESPEPRDTCYVSMEGSRSGVSFVGSFSNQFTSFSTPDRTVVQSTLQDYPPLQCRLDTSVAGALCKGPFEECKRPSCWYAN